MDRFPHSTHTHTHTRGAAQTLALPPPTTPALPSSISIVSRDDATMSRLCKVDIRTRGQQSYSFGEHCDGGVPQTLELFPGEQVLNVVNAFVASEVVPDPGMLAAFGVAARPFVQVGLSLPPPTAGAQCAVPVRRPYLSPNV
jgi:hypothetical protein